MTVGKHLFLDLEDTVITPVVNGWADFEVINRTKVRKIHEVFNPTTVSLFSFAVWNQAELAKFKQFTFPHLRDLLGFDINFFPTVDDDIIPACCRVTGLHPSRVDFSDASAFWGKQQAFRLFVRDRFKTAQGRHEVLLLDDAVWDEDFTWPDINVKGTIFNIDGRNEL